MKARIIGTGSCLPQKIMTNDDLAKMVDTSHEWIYTRTGIKSRHIVVSENGESGALLSAQAAKKAMENAKVLPQEIDFILAATTTPDRAFPNMASLVQKETGAVNAFGFDISAACSGFLFAYNMAQGIIASGQGKKGLVIGCDVMSKMLDWEDRSTCVLFGDGAGAVVVQADEGGYVDSVMKNDGSRGAVLTCNPHIVMDGQEIFKFAVRSVPETIMQLLENNGLNTEDIRYFVLHQANVRILQAVAKRLGVDTEKVPSGIEELGNTSAASIPIMLDKMNVQGLLQKGDKIVLSGFGAGLSWGATLLTW